MKPIFAGALSVIFICTGLTPADARTWKPRRENLAQDYSVINDVRASHDIITIFWLTPPLAETSAPVQALLDRYVIIGVSHVKPDPVTGKMESTPLDAVETKDSDGTTLTPLEGDKVPPTVAGVIAGMGGVMRQSMGVMGEGMRFFAYEPANVHACSKGRLSISYVDETYTYDTPIPGCPPP